MVRLLLFALLCAFFLSGAPPDRAPVLVELFTSEGCSSCPPADRVLEQLDARAIVVSEHVDYWDHGGWKDPFSSHDGTLRQEAYARAFGLDSPYTPEMVVDGAVEFNGSDGKRALAEIEHAMRRRKAVVHVARSGPDLQVDVRDAPAASDVYLAFALDRGSSDVRGGENRGHRLEYVAIVRQIRKIGSVKKGGAFSRSVEWPSAAGQRAIVFLQEPGHGRVIGAGSAGL